MRDWVSLESDVRSIYLTRHFFICFLHHDERSLSTPLVLTGTFYPINEYWKVGAKNVLFIANLHGLLNVYFFTSIWLIFLFVYIFMKFV